MNHDKYTYTRSIAAGGIPWHMDDRHIELLHKLALAAPPNAVIAEIGSHKGASATAYIEAMLIRADITLHLIDINVTEELKRLVASSGVQNRIVIHDYPSPESLVRADMVTIDGDHTIPGALTDLTKALCMGCDVIVLHDTQTCMKTEYPGCEGAHLAGRLLRDHPQRRCWEDADVRTGEQTERGLMVSWPIDKAWPEDVIWDKETIATQAEAIVDNMVRIQRQCGKTDTTGQAQKIQMERLQRESPPLYHAVVAASAARLRALNGVLSVPEEAPAISRGDIFEHVARYLAINTEDARLKFLHKIRSENLTLCKAVCSELAGLGHPTKMEEIDLGDPDNGFK